MKKNIFAFLMMLGMLGFVSCDMGRQSEESAIEPQQQEEEFIEVDEYGTEEPSMDEDQQMQEDESGMLDEEPMREEESSTEGEESSY